MEEEDEGGRRGRWKRKMRGKEGEVEEEDEGGRRGRWKRKMRRKRKRNKLA